MQETRHITILSASETGNSRGVAEDLLATVQPIFSNVRIVDSIDYECEDFAEEDILIMVTSTQGEGEPPFEAEDLYDFIMGKDAPKLVKMSFAVLGLGDSAYGESYNLMARQFDARYEQLGARRIMKHGECDFDYELAAQQWIHELMPVLQKELRLSQGAPQSKSKMQTGMEVGDAAVDDAVVDDAAISSTKIETSDVSNLSITTQKPSQPAAEHHSAAPTHDSSPVESRAKAGNTNKSAKSGGLQEFRATLEERRLLTSSTSEKQVYSIRLRLPSLETTFLPGDMVTVQYPNSNKTVERLLKNAFADKASQVDDRIVDILQSSKDITRNTPALIERYTQYAPESPFAGLPTDSQVLKDYAQTHPPYALFQDFPAQIAPDQMLALFTSSNRRLYSISNAASVSSGYIELTVTRVQFGFRDEHIVGECTNYLTSAPIGTPITISILSNKRFRLPEDRSSDIIMVGLGSAIAPYRAFLQERALRAGDSGRNWLIVGNRNPKQDYLYQDELERYRDQGILESLDIAWSRYGDVREHVQNVVLHQARKLYEWLESGAYLYICGHDHAVIASIEQSLTRAVMLSGRLSNEEAASYIAALQRTNHIQQ
ncbi:flavodoxin domain-containing protein [Bifidobacterium aquikefiri]|uniref:flavodoxin domain-containing protein n=1 Tax=Bifidobacterium aquikefiri TaxID=1653207 RepID=UPI0023F52015|nr:flavodoxin domain-containing protein [Bifidobacterium aquikefiri]